jgi:hypothetical protein
MELICLSRVRHDRCSSRRGHHHRVQRIEKKKLSVNYWEIIAENLKRRGWSLGYGSAIDSNGRTIFIADAHIATMESGSLCVRMKS